MPRLVLFEDDGRELFSGEVSAENVSIVAGFLSRNLRTLRAAAAFRVALGSIADLFGRVNDGHAARDPYEGDIAIVEQVLLDRANGIDPTGGAVAAKRVTPAPPRPTSRRRRVPR